MKKFIISFVAVVVLISILDGSLDDRILMFLLAGVVPGTSIVLSPNTMFGFYAAVGIITTLYISYEHYLSSRQVKRLVSRRSRLPHHRYSHI